MATRDVTSNQMVSSGALWYGILAAPIAWGIRLIVSYALVSWACSRGEGALFLHLVSVVFLVLGLSGVLIAWRSYRMTRAFEPARTGPWRWERSYFMALVGLLNSGLFSLVILAEWSVVFFTDPCVVR